MAPVEATANGADEHAVVATADQGSAVHAVSHARFHAGIVGVNDNPTDEAGIGIIGRSRGAGVLGESETWHAVVGHSKSVTGGFGVLGEAKGTGVAGVSETWIGVYGETKGAAAGVLGEGKELGDGVKGHASGPGKAAVAGFHLTNQGPGVFGRGNPAGQFEGNVVVTGGSISVNGAVLDPAAFAQKAAQLEQLVAQLSQRLSAVESQLNTASSNLTGRVSLLEVTVAGLQTLIHSH